MAEQPAKPQSAMTVQQRAEALALDAAARFRKLQPGTRNRLVAAMALVLACLGAMLWYANRPDWRTLYAGLDPEDARQIGQQLTTAGIPFDVSSDGATLRVPASNLDKARLATTAKGGPKSGRMGFELFDNPNWMGSEFDEKVNYQRALEGELEHTIATLASVQAARVHLVLPHDSLFSSEERSAKASVVLRLRHRTLDDDAADAIANLVASAVDGLRAENVVLVNAEGGGILGRRGSDAGLATREQALAARLIATLEPVAGPGNVRASVNIDLDPTSADELDETYDPAQTATLSMQRNEQTSGQPAASGVPGTASNAPNVKPPLYPASSESSQNLKQESATYAVSKKTRHTVEAAGRVRRVTAAVLNNYEQKGGGGQRQWQARPADVMKQLTSLAQSAIGFDGSRGDQVTVEELAFEDGATPAEPTRLEKVLTTVERSQALLRYGTILGAVLVFLFFVARPVLRSLVPRGRAEAAPGAAPLQIPAGAADQERRGDEPLEEQRRSRAQNVFDQVAESVKRDPVQSSRLLESWIRSE